MRFTGSFRMNYPGAVNLPYIINGIRIASKGLENQLAIMCNPGRIVAYCPPQVQRCPGFRAYAPLPGENSMG